MQRPCRSPGLCSSPRPVACHPSKRRSPTSLHPRENHFTSLPFTVFRCAFEDYDLLALKILTEPLDSLAEQIAMFLISTTNYSPGLAWNVNAVLAEAAVPSFGGLLVGIENYRGFVG